MFHGWHQMFILDDKLNDNVLYYIITKVMSTLSRENKERVREREVKMHNNF